jgi:hypothetical protein
VLKFWQLVVVVAAVIHTTTPVLVVEQVAK